MQKKKKEPVQTKVYFAVLFQWYKKQIMVSCHNVKDP